jgi:hypothetical protein
MSGLIADMTHDDPSQRPAMDEVVERFEKLRKELKDGRLRSRVVGKYDDAITGLMLSVPHWTRRVESIVMRVPPSPTH